MIRKHSVPHRSALIRITILIAGLLTWAIVPLASVAADCSPTTDPMIADCSPTTETFPIEDNLQQSVSGKVLSLTVSSDGQRVYAGTFSGVWRSDNAGETWRQLTRPQPTSGEKFSRTLKVPNVFDVAVSPINEDVVLAATASDARIPSKSKNGIYRSKNGGESWHLVHQFKCPGSSGAEGVGQIVFAPDNPHLVFAAGGCAIAISSNGGRTWVGRAIPEGGRAWHVAVAPREGSKHKQGGFIRRVYAAGDDRIFYSANGGKAWREDRSVTIPKMGTFVEVNGQEAKFGVVGSFPAGGRSNSARILAVEPGHPERVYVAVTNISNGPAYYFVDSPNGEKSCEVSQAKCGGAALWLGDYSRFLRQGQSGTWRRLASPPAYSGGSTDSGLVYVITKETSTGYLLFLADNSHVHVSEGRPEQPVSWHRLDGRDASQSKRDNELGNKLFVHVDPMTLAVSPDFEITLKPSDLPTPFDQNSELDVISGGTIWMGNDGGVYRSTDGGRTWSLTNGLATLQPATKFAVLALPGIEPALYFGVPDNDDFFSLDGGSTWKNDGIFDCADCGPRYSDPEQPGRILEIEGADRGGIAVHNRNITEFHGAPFPAGFVIESPAETGASISKDCYRPIILTLKGEDPEPDGDYILIRRFTPEKRVLQRVTEISKIKEAKDWETIPVQQGPDLIGELNNVYVVQASGGHQHPVFYISDPAVTDGLWKWTEGMPNWKRIIPADDGSAKVARRFFVDPYNPDLIYIIDEKAIKRSDDGGLTWQKDVRLDRAITEHEAFSYEIQTVTNWVGRVAVINDMVFDSEERGTRFAIGSAGVFFTLDGKNWERLLSTRAFPGHPVAAYFDRISDPLNRALYVAMNGRGILRLSPIPAP